MKAQKPQQRPFDAVNGPARSLLSLPAAARAFWRQPTPWMLAAMIVVTAAARLLAGDWRLSDALVPVAVLAVFPFVEWVIHVCVLHWRPRSVRGVTLDSRLARSHRAHHADPKNVALIFIPWQTLSMVIPALAVLSLLAFPRLGLALTFLLTMSIIGLVYEWMHYLIHSNYRPRSRVYRAIWRNHRNHHFKNEHYWFTVTTSGTADRVLGTFPDPKSVQTSPTAKNLHLTTG
ncbi:sterol desaturase family protein [Hoyosella sp. YIM 151337]|uniref:sterol desaturase family protein n=1 Tax=Hoyosella sp. YIM 151337 TaxID=2992742 RepID=UPI0022368BDF|nr:sterol desaturase family protein [Hoyosella sp. YIM 151337]MCW4353912.1 sterol desaturase family protein [Hoyosella sp. YIM 151337]